MKFRMMLLLIGAALLAPSASAQRAHGMESVAGRVFFTQQEDGTFEMRDVFLPADSSGKENPRIVAIALDATLGILGMHRLYLGTDLKVPIAYTLTLGGGGVLWLVDLGLLIFTKDISKFYNNPRLFMWTRS